MDTKLFVATKAFIVNKGKVLIIRESSQYDEGSNVNKYDVPGGRIIPGQQFEESLLREVNEETGLIVKVGQPFHVAEWRPVVHDEQWQVVGIFFKCTSETDKVVLGTDHNEYKWISPSEVSNFNLTEGAKSAFTVYLNSK